MHIFLIAILVLMGFTILYLTIFTWMFHKRYMSYNDEYAKLWQDGEYFDCLRFTLNTVITELPSPIVGILEEYNRRKWINVLEKQKKQIEEFEPFKAGGKVPSVQGFIDSKDFKELYQEFIEFMNDKYSCHRLSLVNWRFAFPLAMMKGNHPHYDFYNYYHPDYVEETCMFLVEFTQMHSSRIEPFDPNDILIGFLRSLGSDMKWGDKLPMDYLYKPRY